MVAGTRVIKLGRLQHGSFALDTFRLARMRKGYRVVYDHRFGSSSAKTFEYSCSQVKFAEMLPFCIPILPSQGRRWLWLAGWRSSVEGFVG